MLAASGLKPARRRKAPRVLVPRPMIIAYFARLRELLAPMREIAHEYLLPALKRAHVDSLHMDAEDFSKIADVMRFEYARRIPKEVKRRTAQAAYTGLAEFNRRATVRQFKAIIGVDILSGDPPLEMLSQIFVSENVSLITSISDRYFGEMEQAVMRAWRSGTRPEDFAAEIDERYAVGESRALLIARDQLGKLNGNITETRQRDLGITKYIWRTAEDERVRGRPDGLYPKAEPSHWDYRNKIFSWDKPPEVGAPGDDYQCRCFAEPVIDGYNDKDTAED
jgi:SPP1 gp7 family putative phage head morphogenesis protein